MSVLERRAQSNGRKRKDEGATGGQLTLRIEQIELLTYRRLADTHLRKRVSLVDHDGRVASTVSGNQRL